MAPATDGDGAEDVNDFLLRIRELGDKRDKEDEERARKLEEEILQGRKERQARRAERARSISPTKDSPLAELPPTRVSLGQHSIDPPETLLPSSQISEPDLSSNTTPKPEEPASAAEDKLATPTSRDGSQSASPAWMDRSARSRSGTLSWQQRPTSRDLGGKPSWPLPSQTQEGSPKLNSTGSGDDTDLSRSQVAESSASKDPSWFHQTPDLGAGSPALRRNQEETMSDTSSITGNMNRPGSSQESTTEPEKLTGQELGDDRSRSPSRASSTLGNSTLSNRYSSTSSVTTGLGSPIPLTSAQKLEPRKVESPIPSQDQSPSASPTQRRMSPERPVSPTKGLGGFVQSAMMKRSDSVSKRWSAQAIPGLNRGNIVTNRGGTGSSSLDDLSPVTRDSKPAREGSTLSTSRPGSSHSEATIVHNTKGTEHPGTSEGPSSTIELTSDEGSVKPSLPSRSRAGSSLSKADLNIDTQSPTSPYPSKTMDPKRWSPTKATWLESALNRPESKRPQQPSWMRDLNKTRQSRGSVDLGKPGSFKEVTPVGLMRSSPPGSHYKKPSVSGLSDTVTSGPGEADKSKESGPKPVPGDKSIDASKIGNVSTIGTDADPSSSPKEKDMQQITKPNATEDGSTPTRRSPPALSPKPNSILSSSSTSSSISPKPKPQSPVMQKQQSPVIDFRANLRRREVTNDNAPKEEEQPEFKNVFGRLKKAETKNYVAPDQLKENILRGKAALNSTGGPNRSQKVDDLKESILKQREAIKAGGGSARYDLPVKPEAPIPEAILRRKNLSRSDSVQSGNSTPTLSSPSLSSPQDRSPSKQSFSFKQDNENSGDREALPRSPLKQSFSSEQDTKDSGDRESPQRSPLKQSFSSKQENEDPGDRESLQAASTADINSVTDTEAPAAGADSSKQNTGDQDHGDGSGVKSEDVDAEAKEKESHEEITQPVRASPPRNDAGAARVAAATKGLATKGTLADRVNPALAGLLSRGPPAVGGGANRPSVTTTSWGSISKPSHQSTNSTSPPALMHVTKTRAKGPKRRLPKTISTTTTSPVKEAATSPVKDVMSSVKDAMSPVKDAMSPVKDVSSPVKDAMSPVKDVSSPVKDVSSPVKDVMSPIKEAIASPVNEVVTSPIRDIAYPTREDATSSVKNDVASLKEVVTSPVKEEDASPIKEDATSPVKEDVTSPIKETAISPIDNTTSPVKENAMSPVKEDVASPVKEDVASPVKEDVASPVKEDVISPVKEVVTSPVKEVAMSPVKEDIVSPVKEDRPVSSNAMSRSSEPTMQEPNPVSPADVVNKDVLTSPLGSPSSAYSASLKASEVPQSPWIAEKIVDARPNSAISRKSLESKRSLFEASPSSVQQEAEKNEGGWTAEKTIDASPKPTVSEKSTDLTKSLFETSTSNVPREAGKDGGVSTAEKTVDTTLKPAASEKFSEVHESPSTEEKTMDANPKPTVTKSFLELKKSIFEASTTDIPQEAEKNESKPAVSERFSERPKSPSTGEKIVDTRPKPAVSGRSLDFKQSLFEASTNSVPQQVGKNETSKFPGRLSGRPFDAERQFPLRPNVTQREVGDKEDIASTGRPVPPPKSMGLPSYSFPPRPTPNPKDSDPQKSSPPKPVIGLGIGADLLELKQRSQQEKALPSPPVPPKKYDISLNTSIDDPARRPSLTSPVPRTTESTQAISGFFDSFPKSSDRVDIDPQLILTAKTGPSKIRTLKKQIWEITDDGKKQDLPVNQEYILYEGSMYLCVHVFESDGGNKSEVHLWCGDDVSDAAIEDAQVFARKIARENSSKLEVVRQGKETANFIQALGGIIITRRGSSSSSSSALYMLCGRRHLGQIAFDEVDFSRRSLCSGYPFVISAKFGKLYLWKGRGSGADEVGGARLIGMDVGLTGEIEEVNEGEEPESFFEVFPDYKETMTYQFSDHWQLKPNYEKYCCRLLRVDHELGQQHQNAQRTGFWNRSRRGSSSPVTRPNDTVQEINPFCQKDIGPKCIYILDTFFELYVIVGEQASSRSAEFASALVFAHEYGILAASLQDRPFIPKSFVALGGVPDECKVAFRKWDKRARQTPPKVLPLNAAIQAIRS
ncbi:hypothetical protein VTN00DRAFT_9179 [Thermoascus crustaceus]|uniref:uncharacterized protein n=1 Tax=Thermoascus crustaceus TaxID=5088 RepID=UPI003742A6B9